MKILLCLLLSLFLSSCTGHNLERNIEIYNFMSKWQNQHINGFVSEHSDRPIKRTSLGFNLAKYEYHYDIYPYHYDWALNGLTYFHFYDIFLYKNEKGYIYLIYFTKNIVK